MLGVARSNLAKRMKAHPRGRLGRPPVPADDLVTEIEAVIAELPTYGYRRVHAILRRKALAEGRPPPNHKRVYRVMRERGLLLQRHAGGAERRHDGRIAVPVSDLRWAGSPPGLPTGWGAFARTPSRSGARTASGCRWPLRSTAATARR